MRVYGYIYAFAYLLLITVIWVLPFYSSEGYSIIKNSISELGGQNVPKNWIMNLTIALLSLSTIALGTKMLKLKSSLLIVLYFFCFSFLLTGIYKVAAINAEPFSYKYNHDALHSLFSGITGFAFSLFCALLVWDLKFKTYKIQTLLVFIMVIGLSYLIFKFPEFKGISQRIMFMLSFGWLFIALVQYPIKKNKIINEK